MATRYSNQTISSDIGTTPLKYVPYGTVHVYAPGTTSPIAQQMYSDAALATPLANPFTADQFGNVLFFLAVAREVKVVVTAGSQTVTDDNAPLHDVDPVGTAGYRIVKASAFGAVGDAKKVSGVTVTSGSPVITCAGAGFTALDVGKLARVMQVSTDTGVWSNPPTNTIPSPTYLVVAKTFLIKGTILSVNAGLNQATLSANAVASSTAGVAPVVNDTYLYYGTNDTAALQAASAAGGRVDLGYGKYAYTALSIGDGTATTNSTVQSVRMHGMGAVNAASAAAATEQGLVGFTTLMYMGAADGVGITINGPIQSCELRGIGLDMGWYGGTGIYAIDYQASVLDAIKIVDFTVCGLDLDAWVPADTGGGSLASNNGGNYSRYNGVQTFSQVANSIGIRVGGPAAAASSDPDVSQCVFNNCATRSDGTSNTVYGLVLRYTDALKFDACSWAARKPISVQVPTGVGGQFPNAVHMYACTTDNGHGSGTDCEVVGVWNVSSKGISWYPFPEGKASGLLPYSTLGGHGMTNDGGFFGDWEFLGALTVDGAFIVGGAITTAQNVNAGTYLQAGANPSASGSVRLPNAVSVNARNAANSADLSLVGSNASNQVTLGDGTNSPDAYVQAASGVHLKVGATDRVVVTGASVSLTDPLLWSIDNNFDIGASGATRPRDLFLGRNAVIGGTLSANGEPVAKAPVAAAGSSYALTTSAADVTSASISVDIGTWLILAPVSLLTTGAADLGNLIIVSLSTSAGTLSNPVNINHTMRTDGDRNNTMAMGTLVVTSGTATVKLRAQKTAGTGTSSLETYGLKALFLGKP